MPICYIKYIVCAKTILVTLNHVHVHERQVPKWLRDNYAFICVAKFHAFKSNIRMSSL